jgi:hypothetical protein
MNQSIYIIGLAVIEVRSSSIVPYVVENQSVLLVVIKFRFVRFGTRCRKYLREM